MDERVQDDSRELLTELLHRSISRRAAEDMADTLLDRFHSIAAVCRANEEELHQVDGLGARQCRLIKALRPLAQRVFEHSLPVGETIRSPADTERFLLARLSQLEHELFGCIFLDNRHRVLSFEPLFRGTIDGTSVYPREVVKEALKANAAAVILAHNHPSGVAEPSNADERITRRLKAALDLVDIRLLDHLVVGHGQVTSLASRGLV